MRNLPLPTLKAERLFDDCISGIANASTRADFAGARKQFKDAESNYLNAASNHVLYQLQPTTQKNEEVIYNGLTKSQIKSLYSEHMVPDSKVARQHYDSLVMSAPYRKCPFCGFGRATTLDHYLGKSEYPWLSIVPINLIPACKDCNHGKGTARARTAANQTIHPYFESPELSSSQWLFASVIETTPLSIDYKVVPPAHWDVPFSKRVVKHFEDFDLKVRFAIESAPVLASLRGTLTKLQAKSGRTAVKDHLSVVAEGEEQLYLNSWKTALYQALAQNDWYIDGGFSME
ncbi:hypothetical protein HNP48_002239 [Acidovorax soli]|uniref:HNH endonuclease n=1 Tax=Acidovorax soli TaxID=592050 RepID=A0A7X0PCU4_9BURK|nr:HNH endonuclease signature motif containing protein [Acidovorax soli]MBB6559572.1 hypothetical protein [Acidovorax soli]